ncbi:MAG: PIG-L family deacetylase [Planctomycetes bacterium]|nr:PIG-L family deacetylase [Planctomycetota bacterium]
MEFKQSGAELYVPDDQSEEKALERVTHMAVGAHQDDLEIMAYHGILECFGKTDRWFLGVTVTNGSGSPRDGIYGRFTDEEMRAVRKIEQRKAAFVGEYAALAALDYTSAAVKDPSGSGVLDDLKLLLTAARPACVYTHNLADKHETHLAVALRVIQAIRELPSILRPKALYGCEVWRDLDWMLDGDKVCFDVSGRENLSAALLGVFDSQICGGKRYDLATMGRRRANATYFASHGTDDTTGLTFGMNLTPLIEDPEVNVEEYVVDHVRRFADAVSAAIRKLGA